MENTLIKIQHKFYKFIKINQTFKDYFQYQPILTWPNMVKFTQNKKCSEIANIQR